MGYYTRYSLNVRNIRTEEQFKNLEKTLKMYDLIRYVFETGFYDPKHNEAEFQCYEEQKWIDHERDMEEIAEKFPDMYFRLNGIGQDIGDYWCEYYHNNQSENCIGEIVYEQPRKIEWDKELVF